MTQYSNPTNEVTTYPVNPNLGFLESRRTTAPEFRVGTQFDGKQGVKWIYVLASESVATGTCTVNTSTFALTDAAGNHTADTAFASGDYGWVRQTAVDVA